MAGNTLVERIVNNGDGTFSKFVDGMGDPKPRTIRILNGVTVAGAKRIIAPDVRRTGLTLRNDSDAQMYFNTEGEAGDGVGYPMDARRGYSFESFGLVPSDPISVWCGVAGARYAVMYSTETADYDPVP
jgi:hypothetical protein